MSGFNVRPLAFGDADITGSGWPPTADFGMPGLVPGFSLFGHSQKLLLQKHVGADALEYGVDRGFTRIQTQPFSSAIEHVYGIGRQPEAVTLPSLLTAIVSLAAHRFCSVGV